MCVGNEKGEIKAPVDVCVRKGSLIGLCIDLYTFSKTSNVNSYTAMHQMRHQVWTAAPIEAQEHSCEHSLQQMSRHNHRQRASLEDLFACFRRFSQPRSKQDQPE
eukprot:1142773-Pelagomonas_calceolata.AAC.3